METWAIIADYYLGWAVVFLVIKNMGFAVKWWIKGFYDACRCAKNDLLYTFQTPILGLIIDSDNSWIYLSLGFHIVIALVGVLYENRIGKTAKIKN